MDSTASALRDVSTVVLISTVAFIVLAVTPVHAGAADERWVVEDFSHALGGGPDGGPVAGDGEDVYSLCGDRRGNLYLASGQFIDIVTPDGQRMRLAGTGEEGVRDGPAPLAEFRMGIGSYYHERNVACAPDGTVYIADTGNRRVRRLAREATGWRVSTWAGGGRGRLAPGARASPASVELTPTFAVAVNVRGEVIIGAMHGAYRVSRDGREIENLGAWPATTSDKPGREAQLNVMMGDADNKGNAYFVSRSPHAVVRVDAEGRISHFAGRPLFEVRRPGDTMPHDAYFDTPTSLAVLPDGSAVFVCGGDEYALRRIPGDGLGSTMTLMQNGRWEQLPVHPNEVRGPATFDPTAKGPSRPRGGTLTIFMINHLVGRDASGNLYGRLTHWVGMTQEVVGSGLLGTHVFRLRRVEAGS